MEYETNPNWHNHIDRLNGRILKKLGPAILSDAKAAVPVLTGDLRASLTWEKTSDTSLRVGSTDLDYSVYVELGHEVVYRHRGTGELVRTGQMVPPQPYLKPALYRKRAL